MVCVGVPTEMLREGRDGSPANFYSGQPEVIELDGEDAAADSSIVVGSESSVVRSPKLEALEESSPPPS